MELFETVRELVRDGWKIEIAFAPDGDYQPGRDDDIYPCLEPLPRYYDESESERDYDGRFLPRPIVVSNYHGERWQVSPEQIAHLIDVGGMNPRTARKYIAQDAEGIATGDLSWLVIRVTASRGSVSGTDYLGGVDFDQRGPDPEKYPLEAVEDHGMIETAIEEAARAVCGDLAPLALSY